MRGLCIVVCGLLWSDPVVGEELSSHPTIVALQEEAIRVRSAAGLTSHPELDEECCQIAQRWANHMASVNSMYHGGGEQIIASGYSSVQSAIGAWRNSGGHWAWLGGRSRLCGWGYQRSANGVCYWAGVFRDRHQRLEVVTSEDSTAVTWSSGSHRRHLLRRRR
jgi:hypothetical protein